MKLSDYTNVISRILLVYLFVWAGVGKIMSYQETAGYMEGMHVSAYLLPLVILLELGGGVAIVLGFLTRFTAMAMAIFSIVAALIFHNDFAKDMQQLMFIKDISIAGGLFLLASTGPGKLSIDSWIKKKFNK